MLVESLILVDLLNLVASGVNNLQLAVVYFLCICGSCGSGNLANFKFSFNLCQFRMEMHFISIQLKITANMDLSPNFDRLMQMTAFVALKYA